MFSPRRLSSWWGGFGFLCLWTLHLSISHPTPSPLPILLSGSDAFVLGFVCLRGWQTKCSWTPLGQRMLAKKMGAAQEEEGLPNWISKGSQRKSFLLQELWDYRDAIQCLQPSEHHGGGRWGRLSWGLEELSALCTKTSRWHCRSCWNLCDEPGYLAWLKTVRSSCLNQPKYL